MLAGATALAILGFAASAQAVSLGDLIVESKPGEPLEALLEINDLDLTISPLLVRVAPPATYLREGVNWPSQVQDLKLARDGTNGTVRLRLYGEQVLNAGSFPLLMEMNAGGTVTVRAYEVRTKDGVFVVTPSAERTTVKGEPRRVSPEPLVVKDEPAAEPSAPRTTASERAQTAQKAAPASEKTLVKASEKETKVRRRGRYAPNVVREYVALNGFDASQPFHVQEDMTLWSVASLYWPSYRGATLEQLVIAFRNRNQAAFEAGDPGRLEARSVLAPPSLEEVLAVDPEAAFREVHGADTPIPGPTQNLIDAQRLSNEAAAKVADAQDRERTAGKASEAVAEAGQQVLEEEKAEAVEQEAAQTAEARAAEAQGQAEAPVQAQGEAPQTESASPSEAAAAPVEAKAPESESVKEESVKEESVKAEPVKTEPVSAAPDASVQAESAEGVLSGKGLFWGLGALMLALLAFFGLRSRKREEAPVEAKKPATVQIQKNVPPTSEAQLKALHTTVDEAVRNGTTAGAMGAGAMAYAMAQKDEAAKEEKVAKTETTSACVSDQPWLEPDDDELPPLDDEEKGPMLGASRKAASILEGVSLDLDDAAPAAASKPAVEQKREPAHDEAPAEEAVEGPVEGPVEAPQRAVPETDKERALAKALDAKLKLASSFVSLGALKEALELLEEVRRRGSGDLRRRAEVLEERIKTLAEEK